MRAPTRSLAFALVVGAVLAGPAAADPLLAGFGVSPLPTPEGGPLAGYGGLRDRRAEGLLDPPEARALVFAQGDLQVALVAVDVLISRPVLRDAILEEARRLDVDSVILAATHTHSGPGGYVNGRVAGRVLGGTFDAEAPTRLARAASQALAQAIGGRVRARVGAAVGRVELAENRREEGGPRETALPVLAVVGSRDHEKGLLFAYGAHPVVLSRRSLAYSADYPGAARAWLASRGWTSAFVAGPLGDQHPVSGLGPLWPEGLETERAQTREIGERLGAAVLSTIEGLTPREGARLHAVERWVELPASRLRRGCLLWWLGPLVRGAVDGFLSARVPIQAVRIGNAVLVAVPAEPTSRVGERIRAAIPADRVPFVVAHANDWIGYVVEADRYRRGGYEACFAFHGPDLADWLVREVAETVRVLESREAAQADPRGGPADAQAPPRDPA